MSLRPPAGFISANYDPLKNPNAPTAVAASGGDASAAVSFTPPANVGGSAISQYQVLAYTGGTYLNNTVGTSSPVSITGLTNGTAYTFQVWALNSYGPSPFSAMSESVTPAAARGLFGGGENGIVNVNTINYITISTTGNALDFGDLNAAYSCAGASSSTRGLFARSGSTSSIVFVTIATTGDSSSFGNLSQARGNLTGGCSDQTRAIWSGGTNPGSSAEAYNTIDYVTIATTGNAIDFGDLTVGRSGIASCASSTRGLSAAGYSSGNVLTNVIDYVTLASTGNAIDFGDTLSEMTLSSACSSPTRGVFAGGFIGSRTNVIQYVTIATTGNAIDFGDLINVVYSTAGTSSPTRGVFAGGNTVTNVIQYITIASTGNALDFGDLPEGSAGAGACSSAHGGLA